MGSPVVRRRESLAPAARFAHVGMTQLATVLRQRSRRWDGNKRPTSWRSTRRSLAQR